jgi:serine/threonine protein kinase
VGFFGKGSDREIAALVADSQKAKAAGDLDGGARLLTEAASMLIDADRASDAIELCVTERDYSLAAEIAERVKQYPRAAKLWFRSGNFVASARALMHAGDIEGALKLLEDSKEYAEAARYFEHQRNYTRASELYAKGGDALAAANALVQMLRGNDAKTMPRGDFQDICRRAATLYAEAGEVDRAVRILRWSTQNEAAAELLIRRGKHGDAIDLLRAIGKHAAAAEIARKMGDEQRALLLIAESFEQEGSLTEAAQHYAQAEAFGDAARMYEFAGDHLNAAQCNERAGQLETAASLYEKAGKLEDAARCLEASGHASEASSLRTRSERPADTIDMLVSSGQHLGAAIGLVTLARGGDAAKYRDAVDLLRAIGPNEPDYISARTMLAEVLEEVGDRKGSLETLQWLVAGTQTKAHVPALYRYGRLLELEGFLARARDVYAAALDLDPGFVDVRNRMALLDQSVGTPSPMPSSLTGVLRLPGTPVSQSLHVPVRAISQPIPRPEGREKPNPSSELEAPAALREAPEDPSGSPRLMQQPRRRSAEVMGLVLRGRFKIEKRVGVGGQARVYLAKDVVLDRPVAIKVLNEDVAEDPVGLERFLREARFAARVHHPKCLAIFDFGQERGLTFMAMEFFEGVTLKDMLKERRPEPDVALQIARDIAEALAAAHGRGIIHRDVKPSNVMVDKKGNAKLGDFGVARSIDGERTSTGMMFGSMAYMAPEQAQGKDVDARADIFSLGVVLFELLTGARPFDATVESIVQRISKPPPEMSAEIPIPRRLREIVRKCMAPRAEDRYGTIEALLADLGDTTKSMKDEQDFFLRNTDRFAAAHSGPSARDVDPEEDMSEEATEGSKMMPPVAPTPQVQPIEWTPDLNAPEGKASARKEWDHAPLDVFEEEQTHKSK